MDPRDLAYPVLTHVGGFPHNRRDTVDELLTCRRWHLPPHSNSWKDVCILDSSGRNYLVEGVEEAAVVRLEVSAAQRFLARLRLVRVRPLDTVVRIRIKELRETAPPTIEVLRQGIQRGAAAITGVKFGATVLGGVNEAVHGGASSADTYAQLIRSWTF